MLEAHIQLEKIAARCAIIPGDPKRLDHIAKYLDEVKELAYNREFRSLSGKYKGMEVIAISSGVGSSSASIVVEELRHLGVEAMIRIGSCGALQNNIDLGDLVIPEGAIRDDGASKAYVSADYPASPNYELLHHIVSICKENAYPHHVGVVHSHESFYMDDNDEIEAAWSKKGVLGSDFETAALFTVGRLRGVKTASILNNVVRYGEDTSDSVTSFVSGENKVMEGEKREILTALEALYRISK